VITKNPVFSIRACFCYVVVPVGCRDRDGEIAPPCTGVGSGLLKVSMAEQRNVRLCLMKGNVGGGPRLRQRLSTSSLESVV
jgi:hypothetical protein